MLPSNVCTQMPVEKFSFWCVYSDAERGQEWPPVIHRIQSRATRTLGRYRSDFVEKLFTPPAIRNTCICIYIWYSPRVPWEKTILMDLHRTNFFTDGQNAIRESRHGQSGRWNWVHVKDNGERGGKWGGQRGWGRRERSLRSSTHYSTVDPLSWYHGGVSFQHAPQPSPVFT